MWKEKIKFHKRGKRNIYLEKISTNTTDYEYHSELLRQQRRFVEGGVFVGKDSETAKTAEETSFSTKTPDYEYHTGPLRQHGLFVESGDFKEKDSEKIEKLIRLLNSISNQYFTLRTILFSYRFSKFFYSVLMKREFLIQFSEDILVQLSKNTIEPTFIPSQILMSAMIISEPIGPTHLKY